MDVRDYGMKAAALIQTGQWEEAVTQLKLAEAIDPNHPAVQLQLYQAYSLGTIDNDSQKEVSLNIELAKKHFQAFSRLMPDKAKELLAVMPSSVRDKLR